MVWHTSERAAANEKESKNERENCLCTQNEMMMSNTGEERESTNVVLDCVGVFPRNVSCVGIVVYSQLESLVFCRTLGLMYVSNNHHAGVCERARERRKMKHVAGQQQLWQKSTSFRIPTRKKRSRRESLNSQSFCFVTFLRSSFYVRHMFAAYTHQRLLFRLETS
jgi:hypothetical protein